MINKYSKSIPIQCMIIVSINFLGINCNPLAFNPSSMPLIAFHPAAAAAGFPQAPLLMAGGNQHFDPYGGGGIAAFNQMPYFMAAAAPTQQAALSPFAMNPFDIAAATNRRSLSGFMQPKNQQAKDEPLSDEQKALSDIPLSFIEPDPPSSLSERISESFSALGEGFKNHFRSMSENFSDTMDDVKDAWRTKPSSSGANSDNNQSEERKRRG